jgi:hypothetical protein
LKRETARIAAGRIAGVGGIVLPEAGYNSDSREDDLIFNDRIVTVEAEIDSCLTTSQRVALLLLRAEARRR